MEENHQMVILVPMGLHAGTKILIRQFAEEMAKKLRSAELKHGYSTEWMHQNWPQADWLRQFREHIDKGDPRDVANYCAFAWYHDWGTNGRPYIKAIEPPRNAQSA